LTLDGAQQVLPSFDGAQQVLPSLLDPEPVVEVLEALSFSRFSAPASWEQAWYMAAKATLRDMDIDCISREYLSRFGIW